MSMFEGSASGYLMDMTSLSNAMRRIWVDYATWTTALINAILFGAGDQIAIRDRIHNSTEELVSLFSQFYGTETSAKMRPLLIDYGDHLARLIKAYDRKDTVAISDLRKDMYALADEFSRLLSQINPNWDRATLQVMLYEIINSTEDEISRTVAREYEKSIAAYDALLDQIYRFADELTYGLQRQFRL